MSAGLLHSTNQIALRYPDPYVINCTEPTCDSSQTSGLIQYYVQANSVVEAITEFSLCTWYFIAFCNWDLQFPLLAAKKWQGLVPAGRMVDLDSI